MHNDFSSYLCAYLVLTFFNYYWHAMVDDRLCLFCGLLLVLFPRFSFFLCNSANRSSLVYNPTTDIIIMVAIIIIIILKITFKDHVAWCDESHNVFVALGSLSLLRRLSWEKGYHLQMTFIVTWGEGREGGEKAPLGEKGGEENNQRSCFSLLFQIIVLSWRGKQEITSFDSKTEALL